MRRQPEFAFLRAAHPAGAARCCGCGQPRWLMKRRIVLLAVCMQLISFFTATRHASGATALSILPSWSKRREAIKNLPLEHLSPAQREVTLSIAKGRSLFRRLPEQEIECDPELYGFLLANPEVVVNIWRMMGISRVNMVRHDDGTIEATDGQGTHCHITVLLQTPESVLLYATGSYNGPLYPQPLQAKCVIHLRSQFGDREDGSYIVRCGIDAFIDIDNVGVEILVRTVQPLVGRVADHNFEETTLFMQGLSRTLARKPLHGQALSIRLTEIPLETRDRFAKLAAEVANRNEERRFMFARAPSNRQ